MGWSVSTRWRASPEKLRSVVLTVVYALAGAAAAIVFLKLTKYLYDRGLLEDYAGRVYDTVMGKYFAGTFKEQFPDWEA